MMFLDVFKEVSKKIFIEQEEGSSIIFVEENQRKIERKKTLKFTTDFLKPKVNLSLLKRH